mmetsp:Transcript_15448/g.26564  ORF Transcript_15448/g.26564 Transcript_15448/m.26564 type:complete len:123 (+) Transcript_15448:89-457(+)
MSKLFAILCLVGFAMLPGCVQGQCSQYTDCYRCASSPTCGWCTDVPSSDACQAGTSNGPTNGACSGSSWHWTRTSCQELCSAFDDRTQCEDQVSCGWCVDNSRCITGTASGPLGASCSTFHA